MPYLTDNDSKATRRITEIERRLQEAKAELEQWLAAGHTPINAAELARREREGKQRTDRLQALVTALELQRALAAAAVHEQERKLAKAWPKKMKDFGYRPVTVKFLGGLEVELMARYWCRSEARADRGKGSYYGLTLLGVCDRCTPALASEVAQLAAALSSFEDAQALAANGGGDVDSADCQRGIPFCATGAESAGSGGNGHRGVAGGEAGRGFHGRRKVSRA